MGRMKLCHAHDIMMSDLGIQFLEMVKCSKCKGCTHTRYLRNNFVIIYLASDKQVKVIADVF